jgi:hypothetical protein
MNTIDIPQPKTQFEIQESGSESGCTSESFNDTNNSI